MEARKMERDERDCPITGQYGNESRSDANEAIGRGEYGGSRNPARGERLVCEQRAPSARAGSAAGRRARARTHTLTRACWPVRAEGADVLAPRRESRANKSTLPHY